MYGSNIKDRIERSKINFLRYSHILFAYCLVRVAFWLLALVSFAKMRYGRGTR